MPTKKISNVAGNKAVVEPSQAIAQTPSLSTQQQAAHDNATTQTKNDGSHIAQQRAARLSQHKSKATKTKEQNNADFNR